MLTPLHRDETVDQASLRRLIDFLIDGGVHGIWVMGTTGEFPLLPETERARAVALTTEHVAGRIPVIANVGDSSTALALRHARHAVEAGADALACTPPHYYLHSMDEMLAHYREIRQAVDLPLLIYNIPQTVKVRMELGTTLELAEEGTVVGLKDSQNDLQWFRGVCTGARERGLDFRAFLGSAVLIDAAVAVGAIGSVPGVANVAPRECVECHEAAERGDFAAAARAQERAALYQRLATAAAGGSPNAASFSAMKTYLRQRGIIAHNTVAAPLRPLTVEEEARVVELMKSLPEAVPAAV